MHTRNVNVRTAAQESSRKMGGNAFCKCVLQLKAIVVLACDEAAYSVALAEEAHAHYGEPFGKYDQLANFIQGFFQGLLNALKKGGNEYVSR